MTKRREFIKGLLAGSATTLSTPLWAKEKDHVDITILHTNDLHSRIEPFPLSDPKYSGLGGFTRLSGKINDIRKEHENVLLLDAGDIFQGTPYFNLYGGEIEYKLMSEMGYFASTLGNHDFDNGIEGLLAQVKNASFQFINCNYDLSNSPLKEHVVPYKIKEFKGIRIGVLGVGIKLEGLVDKKNYGDIIYMDPIEHANETAKHLKLNEQCDLIICLSHLGYSYPDDRVSDIDLTVDNQYIDLIIGGHTHTFLDKPTKMKSIHGKKTMINQVGWAGINLGKIDYRVQKLSGESEISGTNLIVKSLV